MGGGRYIDIDVRFPARRTRAAGAEAKGQETALLLLQGIGVWWQRIGDRGRGRRGAGRQVVQVRGGGRSRFVQEISNTAGGARLADRILGRILARIRGRRGERYRRLGRVIAADNHAAHNGTAPQTETTASAAGDKRFRWRGMHG